jgi:hypothetical protein
MAIEISFSEVLAAARQLVDFAAEHGWWRSYELSSIMAERLGVSHDRNYAVHPAERRAVKTFDGQVIRAFNKLAGEGVLIKVGKGQRSPTGQLLTDCSEFWTPVCYQAAKEKHEHELGEQAAERARWALVWQRLDQYGLTPASPRGEPVTLTLDNWRELMRKLSRNG